MKPMTAIVLAEHLNTLWFSNANFSDRRDVKDALDEVLDDVMFKRVGVQLAIANRIKTTSYGLTMRKLLFANVPQSRSAFENFWNEMLFHLEANYGWPGMYEDYFVSKRQGGGMI